MAEITMLKHEATCQPCDSFDSLFCHCMYDLLYTVWFNFLIPKRRKISKQEEEYQSTFLNGT